MDRANQTRNISRTADLSIELRVEAGDSSQTPTDQTEPEDTPSTATSNIKAMRSDSASPTQGGCVSQQRPSSQGEFWSIHCNRSVFRYSAYADHAFIASELPLGSSGEAPDSKKNDCLLLEYQSQLVLLECMNRRSTRKLRQPH